MPFQSEAQRRFLWAKHPEVAKRWAHEYGSDVSKTARKALKRRRKRESNSG